MYIIRNIFYLKFGHYKDAKALLDDANKKGLLPESQYTRILTDFTGDAYRLILEEGYNTLADFEQHFQNSMAEPEWKQWYELFKQHVDHSYREILKQIV
jgi:hypothetical protein